MQARRTRGIALRPSADCDRDLGVWGRSVRLLSDVVSGRRVVAYPVVPAPRAERRAGRARPEPAADDARRAPHELRVVTALTRAKATGALRVVVAGGAVVAAALAEDGAAVAHVVVADVLVRPADYRLRGRVHWAARVRARACVQVLTESEHAEARVVGVIAPVAALIVNPAVDE